jgi:outer membrane protein OmpA-like peptidoglycan-associated protein
MARLTVFSKLFLTSVVAASFGYIALRKGAFDSRRSAPVKAAVPVVRSACSAGPEVRMELWAWNAQQGLLLANGGAQSTVDSAMCKAGVNLKLLRQDDPSKMREDLIAFATALKSGERQPSNGVAFVGVMGDGSAAFLTELNATLDRLGPEYRAKVIGSAGYSWGEDKLMGPPAWKKDPRAARGGVVAGVLRDGDWNIALKWLAENQLCNNPDEHTWDASCLNWVATPGYVEAAQAYVAGYCEDRAVVVHGARTGEKKRVCVDGVVTWTPGDVTVAHERGGLVSIVSTREYRGQMPHVFIGIDRWMTENRSTVEGLLSATFDGARALKADAKARETAAGLSAQVYGEETPDYWARYFTGVVESDKQGLQVELGGSRVNELADDLYLFGVHADGSADVAGSPFAATYTVFGDIVVAQYPELVPRVMTVSDVVDVSYLSAVAKRSHAGVPELEAFDGRPVRGVVSRGNWSIPFETGSARFSRGAEQQLDGLYQQLVIAGGTAVEVHGHTDSRGEPSANRSLSEARAFAVKQWLEAKSPQAFPDGRVRVFAHGQDNPLAPNATEAGRATNRRVEIVLGTL